MRLQAVAAASSGLKGSVAVEDTFDKFPEDKSLTTSFLPTDKTNTSLLGTFI